MHFFSLSAPLVLLASLALSAPIDDAIALITRGLEKRTDFLINNGVITSNPTPELLVERGAVVGCFLPTSGIILYFTKAYDCAQFKSIKVYPAETT